MNPIDFPTVRLARVRRCLLPSIVIETVSRFVGWLVDLNALEKGYSAEIRLRAMLTNLRFGTQLKELGRGAILARPSRIHFGPNTSLRSNVVIMTGAGWFVMGEGSHVSHHTVIGAGGGVTIGKDCAISSSVTIYSISNVQPAEGEWLTTTAPLKEPVLIGDHVHVGAGATILPGITIGNRATIGAGAVVTRSVPPNAVVAGVPARAIKEPQNE